VLYVFFPCFFFRPPLVLVFSIPFSLPIVLKHACIWYA